MVWPMIIKNFEEDGYLLFSPGRLMMDELLRESTCLFFCLDGHHRDQPQRR